MCVVRVHSLDLFAMSYGKTIYDLAKELGATPDLIAVVKDMHGQTGGKNKKKTSDSSDESEDEGVSAMSPVVGEDTGTRNLGRGSGSGSGRRFMDRARGQRMPWNQDTGGVTSADAAAGVTPGMTAGEALELAAATRDEGGSGVTGAEAGGTR